MIKKDPPSHKASEGFFNLGGTFNTTLMLPWHQYVFALILLVSGVFHFVRPKIYERIMPPYIPAHSSMILLSGILEMVFGLMLLNPDTQTIAVWAIIAMLVAFLTAHFYMLQDEKASLGLPKWLLVIRILLQFGLMYWVYQYV